MTDGVAEGLQCDCLRPDTLARPPQRRVEVAGRRRFYQRIELAQQRGIERGRGFPASPGRRLRLGGNARRVSNSRKPRSIVGREIPITCSTKPMPPVNTGARAAYLARSVVNRAASPYQAPFNRTSDVSQLFPDRPLTLERLPPGEVTRRDTKKGRLRESEAAFIT
jgi:hypothetical protein